MRWCEIKGLLSGLSGLSVIKAQKQIECYYLNGKIIGNKEVEALKLKWAVIRTLWALDGRCFDAFSIPIRHTKLFQCSSNVLRTLWTLDGRCSDVLYLLCK